MNDFKGKSDLRDASLKLFSLYKSVINTELKTMAELTKNPTCDVEQDEKKFNKLNDQALKKMDAGLKEFQEEQLKFSENFHFELNKPEDNN